MTECKKLLGKSTKNEACLRGAVANVLDCDIRVNHIKKCKYKLTMYAIP